MWDRTITLLKRENVQKGANFKCANCPTSMEIARFEYVPKLFLKSKKSAIAQLHFWKKWQKVRAHNRTFEKSEHGMCKCAIAQP